MKEWDEVILLAAGRLAEAVQDYLDCREAGCADAVEELRHELGAYFEAGGRVTTGGEWE